MLFAEVQSGFSREVRTVSTLPSSGNPYFSRFFLVAGSSSAVRFET